MSEQLIQTPSEFGENGNFMLERELGAGGMGGVYMGRDKMLDRPVAVKVMLKEYGADQEFVEKFKKEAQAAAKLIHPNIAQIYSFGICNGMPYIAMELVSGGSLYSMMQATPGQVDIPRVMKMGQQIALALQCASDQGFVHGDVKPENILIDANGNAKIIDFGLAAMQKDTDEIWGTPYYIAPEKVRKEPIDFRADMYSLGCTLFHALTGVPPFDGDEVEDVVKRRFEVDPAKPSSIRNEITPAIDALLLKMIAREKTDRFPSFEALLKAFNEVLANGLTAKAPTGPTKKVIKMKVRHTQNIDATVGDVPEMPTDAPKTKNDDEDEEEEGGNLGLKVALFVVGGLLAIGAIVGGLIWYVSASEKSEKAAVQQQIDTGITTARAAIADTVNKAHQFSDEFSDLVAKTQESCKNAEEKLGEFLPPEAVTAAMVELKKRSDAADKAVALVKEQVEAIEAKAAEGDALKDASKESMEKLADLSQAVVDMLEQMRSAKAVEEARKAAAFIRDRGKSTIEQAKRRMEIEKKQADRKKAEEEKAAAEKEKAEKAEAAKKAKIEEETAGIKAKFEELAKGRELASFNLTGAITQLETMKSDFDSAEGQVAADIQIQKLNNVAELQEFLCKHAKDYTFKKKSSMKGMKIVKADAHGLQLLKADGKGTSNMSWTKFCKENAAAYKELLNYYVFQGRTNVKPKPNLKTWSELMLGAATTLHYVCEGEDANAQQLAKAAVKEYADCKPLAEELFPDVTFDASDDDDEE